MTISSNHLVFFRHHGKLINPPRSLAATGSSAVSGRKRLSDIVLASVGFKNKKHRSLQQMERIFFLFLFLFLCVSVVCKAVVFFTFFLYLCLCHSFYFAVIVVSAIAFCRLNEAGGDIIA